MKKLLFIVALTTLSIARPYSVSAADCVSAPSHVFATSGPGSGQVTVSWDGVSGASSYAVVYGTKSGSYVYGGDPIGEASSRQYTVNALQPGARYYFRVIAKRDECPGPWSDEVHAGAGDMMTSESVSMMQAGVPAASFAKAGPVDTLKLWAKSGPNPGEVTLYWQNADSANDYHLMYGAQAGSYAYGALNIGNVQSFTVRSLVQGNMYHFALVPLLNGRPLYTTASVGVSAYMNPPISQEPISLETDMMRMVTPGSDDKDQTMDQQSMFADDGAFDDEEDEMDEDENDDQSYMMFQGEEFSDDEDEDDEYGDNDMAQQYLMDPEESRTGSPYDPLFE